MHSRKEEIWADIVDANSPLTQECPVGSSDSEA